MKTNQELIQEGFHALNSYKRSRTLAEKNRKNGCINESNYHELKKFKEIDRIELALRALNSNDKSEEE